VNQPSLTLPSFAKINWNLQILGKRADGYHEVRTVLQTIDLGDELHFEVSEDAEISLSCDHPEIPIDDRNLVVRAAVALRNRYKTNHGAHIRLDKKIPAKGGLGGGSSNAAVTLLALAHLWKLETNAPELSEIAATLGADVPFFLLGGRALATGTGTIVSALPDQPQRHLIVVTPNASVPTPKAYAALNSSALTTLKPPPILSSSLDDAGFVDSHLWTEGEDLNNDFESVIFDMEPEIRRAKEALLQAGASVALLAGSGSSVFGIFSDREAQQRVTSKILSEAGWRVFPCDTLSRTEYVRALSLCDVSFLRSFNSEFDIGA
jgi:4-diphosphocytidyl-2-C-methyl-D-erythritol kinase